MNRKRKEVLTEQTKTNPQGTLKAFRSDQDKNPFLILH